MSPIETNEFQQLINSEVFSETEKFFVEKYLSEKDEEAAIFLGYLFLISRHGYVYLEIEKQDFFPKILNILPICGNFLSILQSGARKLSQKYCTELLTLNMEVTTPVCKFKNRYYLNKNWVLARRLAERLHALAQNVGPIDNDEAIVQIERLFLEKQINEEQKKALEKMHGTNFFLLCGGPGTGKTYVTAKYLQMLFSQDPSLKIVISSFTGKAAYNFSKYLINCRLDVRALTLHALLKIKENQFQDFDLEKLDIDVLIIDEASMIDLEMMAYLLDRIAGKTKVIFLGDPNQLPPIETGNIFTEMASHLSDEHKTCLKKKMRFENIKILNLINSYSDEEKFLEMLFQNHFVEYDERGVLQEYADFWGPSAEKMVPAEVLALLNKRVILTPNKVGKFGSDGINGKIFEKMIATVKMGSWFTMPIIATKNDYKLGIFNGMHGVFINRFTSRDVLFDGMAYFKDGAHIKEVPLYLLKGWDRAYCMTIHKSQGAEFEQVFLIIPGDAQISRELIYTAVTRAKTNLRISADRDLLKSALKNKVEKPSSVFSIYKTR